MTLVEWLIRETEQRGWSYNQLAKRAGLSSSGISLVLSGQRRAGFEFCTKIARAFSVPAEDVLRRAGLLPPVPTETPSLREVIHLFNQLSPEQQDNMIAMARALLAEQKRRSKEKRPSAAEAT